jgi:hypothetical protein
MALKATVEREEQVVIKQRVDGTVHGADSNRDNIDFGMVEKEVSGNEVGRLYSVHQMFLIV